MDREVHLPEPPRGFRDFGAPALRFGLIRRLYARHYWRCQFLHRAVWVTEDNASPTKVVSLGMQVFDSPAVASNFWRTIVPTPKRLASLAHPPPESEVIGDDALLVRWRRGDLYVTSLDRRAGCSVISTEAVATTASDQRYLLEAVSDVAMEAASSIPQAKHGTPLIVRQIVLGLLMGLPFLALIVVAGETLGRPVALGVAVAGVAASLIFPRLRLRQLQRQVICHGDEDGTIERALKSLGV